MSGWIRRRNNEDKTDLTYEENTKDSQTRLDSETDSRKNK